LHTGSITSITFLKDGQTFVSAGEDARWIEWDRARGSVVRSATIRFPDRAPNRAFGQMTGSIAVSPDGAHVVGWPAQGTFYQYTPAIVFDRFTGKEMLAIEMTGDRMNRTFGAKPIFSSDGTRLISPPCMMHNSTEDQRARIWDVKKAAKTAEITLRAGNSTAAFTPDDSRLVTATIALGAPPMPGVGVNGSAELVIVGWDLKTGKKLGEFTISNWGSDLRLGRRNGEVHIAAVNNSSAVLASSTRIWGVDFEAGRDGFEIDSFPSTQILPCTIAASKDGKLIAAGVPLEGEDKFGVRIYDAVRGNKLHTFTGHSGPVTALTFSPDGKFLASGSEDTTILLWDMSAVKE
jgi:WD40 repeat protein